MGYLLLMRIVSIFLILNVTYMVRAMIPFGAYSIPVEIARMIFTTTCNAYAMPPYIFKQVAVLRYVCTKWNAFITDTSIATITNRPPLHCAVARGDICEVIRLKLDEKHSILEPDINGYIPLYYAYYMNQLLILGLLQAAKAGQEKRLVRESNYFCSADQAENILQKDDIEAHIKLFLRNNILRRTLLTELQERETRYTWSYNGRRIFRFIVQGIAEYDMFHWAKQDTYGWQLYHYSEDKAFVLKSLQSCGANINAYNEDGFTALHCVCRNALHKEQSADIVSQLLQASGIDTTSITRNPTKSSVLHLIARHKNNEITKKLLETGTGKIDMTDAYGCTALHIAAMYDNAEAIKLLLEYKANCLYRNTLEDSDCVEYAVEHDALQALEILASNEQIHFAQRRTALLCRAVIFDSFDCMQYLINKDADVDITDQQGNTLLHQGVIFNSPQCVPMLIKNYQKMVHSKNKQGSTPLIFAMRNKRTEFILNLLNAGAEVNAVDNIGNSALHYAAMHGDWQIINILCMHGAQVNGANFASDLVSYSGFTPLHYAVLHGKLDAVKILIRCGADVSLRTADGKTALDLAKEKKHTDVIYFLRS